MVVMVGVVVEEVVVVVLVVGVVVVVVLAVEEVWVVVVVVVVGVVVGEVAVFPLFRRPWNTDLFSTPSNFSRNVFFSFRLSLSDGVQARFLRFCLSFPFPMMS